MQNAEIKNCELKSPDGFCLGVTLLSGQCFRWNEDGDGYTGIAFGRRVNLIQKSDKIIIIGDDDTAIWREYLDLDTDYDSIRREVISLDPRLEESTKVCGGVRILRQDPWEALCSFVISQNNNIGRIRLIINRLCSIHNSQFTIHNFPDPELVASLSEEALNTIGCGYRSPYILAVAKAAMSGQIDFDGLRTMSVDEARAKLTSVHGIGPKVADCALLYGLHRLECFPRDVWIRRALKDGLVSEEVARSRYAGVAQQYVFEYIRSMHNAQFTMHN